MFIPKPLRSLPPAQRRRLTLLAFVRILATSLSLVALYYLVPLDQLEKLSVPVPASLSVALLILAGAVTWQVISITRADYPAIRAVEALSVTTPLFLLLFAAAYFILAQDNPANFSTHTHTLTRTDTLYFTVSTFTTVGFGDITATSKAAHLIVTVQMLLDLLVLGLGLRLFLGAVRTGESRLSDTATDTSP
ncbi:ion channel [Streptomyces sp. NBC_00121]|uniref:potassium channel family protein n=1 Tax=unclassified Streptomyces TaxID=2593676 RepID=UPI002DD98984|nr:ion channel [Streptomyces sp. NBC_01760]WSC73575.1 ion channel [Streptomyces sp. NBC_01760]